MPSSILVAEDYDDNRDLMVFILSANGHTVYPAANGLEALQIARTTHLDLILMDLSMPVMSGLQATEMIRATNDFLAKIPIIAVTAYDTPYQEKALKAGCNYVIIKPVDFDELDLTIAKYLAV